MLKCKKQSEIESRGTVSFCYEQGKIWRGGASAARSGAQRGGQGSAVHPESFYSLSGSYLQVIPDPTNKSRQSQTEISKWVECL